MYGYWLASGEVMAYAALTEFGVLGDVPWLIAEADGGGDRARNTENHEHRRVRSCHRRRGVRHVVLVLWHLAPTVLSLAPADRAAIAGPLTTIACVTAMVLPLRVAGSTLAGLQDVKFYGAMSTATWALDLVITVTLLKRGYGLYALALGAACHRSLSAGVMVVRLRIVAPDLVRGMATAVEQPPSPGCSAKASAHGSAPGAGASRCHRCNRGCIARPPALDHDAGDDGKARADDDADVVGPWGQQPRWAGTALGRAAARSTPRRRRRCLSRLSRARDRRHLHTARGQRCVRHRVGRPHLFAGSGCERGARRDHLVSTLAHAMAVVASALGSGCTSACRHSRPAPLPVVLVALALILGAGSV